MLKTADSAKENLKVKFLKGIICLQAGSDRIRQLCDDWLNRTQMKIFSLLIML